MVVIWYYNLPCYFCFSFHLVARAKACVNDYRAALNAEKTAFSIYSSKVKKQHELNIIYIFLCQNLTSMFISSLMKMIVYDWESANCYVTYGKCKLNFLWCDWFQHLTHWTEQMQVQNSWQICTNTPCLSGILLDMAPISWFPIWVTKSPR